MKHSGMHAGDLWMVLFRHHLARKAVWIRRDFIWTLDLNCLTAQKSAIKCENIFCRNVYVLLCHTVCF